MPTEQKSVWIPATLHRELKIRAAATGRSMGDLLAVALHNYLDLPLPPELAAPIEQPAGAAADPRTP